MFHYIVFVSDSREHDTLCLVVQAKSASQAKRQAEWFCKAQGWSYNALRFASQKINMQEPVHYIGHVPTH